ncbi:hypothetical protein AQI88_30335 [Streptomyces cellostaticus]|uniref:HAD family hydrolase n=1 Tax=Streptomyces cellostaticus TaxID=67285 RepID=A0A101NGI6_9ACTN|nr:HAD family hydrolase [Streptomyces cellostaticus]KUM92682.1 hypothetical protein AQI88_30335 [Streptomyces cellostaticus]GHI06716.1 hydrolase [Streptomyces cellostaticus]
MGGERQDVEDAWERLTDAGCVLFDFDGPICRLYPRGAAVEWTDKDPYLVLREVHRARAERRPGDLVEDMDAKLTEFELAAVPSALPTPGADQLVTWLHGRGSRLAVVTNNAARAADRYLRDHGLRPCFEAVHGRSADPDLMKPDPDVLHRALRGLGLRPDEAVMIGDTPADFDAAERAGVRFIGYGRNAEKRLRLRDAGAKVVLGSYGPVLELARHAGPGGNSASPSWPDRHRAP